MKHPLPLIALTLLVAACSGRTESASSSIDPVDSISAPDLTPIADICPDDLIGDVSVISTPDSLLRFFTWNTQTGGSSPNFAAYASFPSGDTIRTVAFAPFSIDSETSYVCIDDLESHGIDAYEAPLISALHRLPDTAEGNPLFLVECYHRSSSSEAGSDVLAIELSEGTLLKRPIFDNRGLSLDPNSFDNAANYPLDQDTTTSVDRLYNIPAWYFLTDGLGWDWVMAFNPDSIELYAPAYSGNYIMTDRYNLYRYSDGMMRFSGIVSGGYWLHPTLRNFKVLSGIYSTDSQRFRVDLMPDDTYRLAIWPIDVPMTQEPELIITNGRPGYIEGSIAFVSGDDTYLLPADHDSPYRTILHRRNSTTLLSHDL